METTNGHQGRATRARAEAQRIAVQTGQTLRHAGSEVRRELEASTTGAALAGAAVVGAALIFGLPEALLGAIAGLVVHHILKSQQMSKDVPAPR